MSRGGRPGAVRRFLRRPWVWVGVALVAAPALIWADAQGRNDAAPGPDALRVEAVVQSVTGVSADVAYDHPLTAQRVEASVPRRAGDENPAEGARLTVTVDRDDPENLRLPGDRPAPTFDALALGLLLGVPLLWCAVRWWSVHASERLAGQGTTPTFAMVGALAAPRSVGRRPCLHLWPLDSPAGAEALCAVPLIVSGGLPIGTAFPVEVKGSPRAFGRVVARAGDTVLWPAARSLRTGWMRRPSETVATPPTLGRPPDAPPVGPTGRRSPGFPPAPPAPLTLGLAVSVAVCAVVTTITLLHQRSAERLYRNGTEVIAEVTKQGSSTVTVRYTPAGETTVRTGQAPVDWPGEQKLGLKLPAVVDPDHPGRLRLRRERYDAREPIGWSLIPVAGLTLLLLAQFRIWRRSSRTAARGTWRPVVARRRSQGEFVSVLEVSSTPGSPAALEIRVPTSSPWSVAVRKGRWVSLEMAGDPDPGSPIALRHHGEILPVSGTARVPRRSGPRRPLPFRGVRWRAPRRGTDPTAS